MDINNIKDNYDLEAEISIMAVAWLKESGKSILSASVAYLNFKEGARRMYAALQPSPLPLIETKKVWDRIVHMDEQQWRECDPDEQERCIKRWAEQQSQSVPLIDKGQEAIEFADFVGKNYWYNRQSKVWYSSESGYSNRITTKALYELFLNKKQ